MRTMRYTAYTYCLKPGNPPTGNNGDMFTLGSRDKYWFSASRRDGNAELYVIRFNDGRSTKTEHNEYEMVIVALADCGNSTDIYLETGDITLGIASSHTTSDGGSGCTPYLYMLRPVFSRNSGTANNPTNRRGC